MGFPESLLPSLRKRRSLSVWVAFSLCVLAGLTKLGEWIVAQHLQSNWEDIRGKDAGDLARSVQNAFREYQQETSAEAGRIAGLGELREELAGGPDPERLFSALERAGLAPEMNAEVYDRDENLIAWWGRTAGLEHGQVDVQRETSLVSRGPVYSYLTVIVPVSGASGVVGTVVVHRLFDVNYPLSNRFMSAESFTRTFPRRLDIPVVYDFSNRSGERTRDNAVAIPLLGAGQDTIGYGFADQPTLSAAIEQVHQTADVLSSLFLAGLSAILFFGIANFIHGFPGFAIRSVIMTALMWILRYGWLWMGFPSAFLSTGIFDPRTFASPFGFGIARSPGELLITCTFLLTNVAYIALLLITGRFGNEGMRDRMKEGGSRGVLLLVVPVLASLFFLLDRGFTAAVRSAVFDSTLYYNDPVSVMPQLDVAIMLLNMLFLALAFFIASLLIVLAGWQVIRCFVRDGVRSGVATYVVFAASGVLFGVVHPSPLTGLGVRLLVLTGVFLAAVPLGRQVFEGQTPAPSGGRRPWLAVVGALAVVLAILTYRLDDQVHQKERRTVELLAADLGRPVDTWLTYLLGRAIEGMAREEAARVLISGDFDEIRNLAFTQWARSVLSKEGYNCSVSFFDSHNHLVSNFRVGVAALAPGVVTVAGPGSAGKIQTTVSEQSDASGKRKYYAGSGIIETADGAPAGHVEVVISARDPVALRGEVPPVLRSNEREEAERHLRSLVISEFHDGQLVYTTGEEFSQHIRPRQSVFDGLRTERSIWVEERIGGSDYETLYMGTGVGSGDNTVLALSRKRTDWRWQVFDYLRFLLFFATICVLSASLVVIALWLRGYRFTVSFRTKLLIAFLVVSLIPLLFLAYYNRNITVESAHQSILERLTNQTAVVRNHLLTQFRGDLLSDSAFLQNVSDDWCEKIAYEFGTDFSVYVDGVEKGSSKPELFRVGILERRLSGNAYVRLTLDGQAFFAETVTIGNYDYLVGYRSLLSAADKKPFAILAVPMLYTQTEVTEDLARRSALLFGAYAFVMLIGVMTGTVFAHQISAPIRQLIAATRRIASGDLDFRIHWSRKDEIGELHEAFNKMTEELNTKRTALLKAERELAWKEMAKQVAHEIKNPLTPIRLSIQHLRQAFQDGDKGFPRLLDQVTGTIIDQIDSLSRIASQFAHFARMPERREEYVDVQEVLAEAARLFEEHKAIAVELARSPEPMIVRADREELRRVFINVIRNAVQAMDEKGTVRLRSQRVNEVYRVSVSDTGPGIPEDVRPRLFEPNFSTKSEGMGLGLAIVKKTVDDLGGTIEIQSKAGEGTTVIISLPARPGGHQ